MSEKNLIQSVERAARIFDCFDSLNLELSLSQISEKLNLNISTVHGIINTLVAHSYIDKDLDNGKYKLGIKFLLKGNIVSESLDFKKIGHPYLIDLTKKYNETTHLYSYRNGEIYCIDKIESPHTYLIMSSKAGGSLPMHAAASGKAILANLSSDQLDRYLNGYKFIPYTNKTIINRQQLIEDLRKTKNQGFGIEDEEIELGAYSISVAIMDVKNRVLGTISIVGPTIRMKEKEQEIFVDLLAAGNSISNSFGYFKK
ncbi:IclR family transcriptional regulator [Clostridium aminobutyricum]|uniref:Glycerol operon regulatory protein n=1 Tax=Clostridium aminobutyricum TaxID=33953 RepID=A0A939DA35_CLOAM|nr:IclR family transcriptional regulator [Clostridium aminobutyricum]MBN7774002.1 IclR family transcriptional regulator [Clostridium aminobutyricum]